MAYGILKEVMQVDAKERNLSMALKIFSEATAVEMKLNGNPGKSNRIACMSSTCVLTNIFWFQMLFLQKHKTACNFYC